MPDMTYGWAKLTCEYLAQIAFVKYELKFVTGLSGYGEDQDLNYPFPSI